MDPLQELMQENGASATYCDDDDDYVFHSFSAFALCDDVEDDKYFTWLPVSVSSEESDCKVVNAIISLQKDIAPGSSIAFPCQNMSLLWGSHSSVG